MLQELLRAVLAIAADISEAAVNNDAEMAAAKSYVPHKPNAAQMAADAALMAIEKRDGKKDGAVIPGPKFGGLGTDAGGRRDHKRCSKCDDRWIFQRQILFSAAGALLNKLKTLRARRKKQKKTIMMALAMIT